MLKKNLSILSITLGSGGSERVISLLLKELIHDYNITLILLYNEIHFHIPKEVNIIFLSSKSPNRSFFHKIVDTFFFIIKYQQLLKKTKIDYAVSFLAFPNLINGIIATFNKKVKTIISERGFPSDNVTSKLSLNISKLFYPVFYNRCTKLFSNSVYINEDLNNNFGVKIPMEVIYNPVEIPETAIIPNNLGHNTDDLQIITSGTLNVRKNQIMIIKAILSSERNFQLTILGDGPLKEFLNEEIGRHNLKDKVYLKGKVKNVNDHLLKSDCFVLSSFTEGFPNALLEAMAIGLPCISTNCLSGPLELLHDNKEIDIKKGEFFLASYGILVNNDDHKGLKKALDFFHNHPEELKKYSQLSLERSKKYHLSGIYEQFKQFINS